MDLKNLRTFQTVVQEGGFNKAAEKLNYTQSTITFRLTSWSRSWACGFLKKLADAWF